MRLKRFLIEQEADYYEVYADTIDKIKKECQPYLRTIKPILNSSGYPFMRGISGSKYASTGKIPVRQQRKGLHPINKDPVGKTTFKEATNKWLEDNGHARRDKSISCTSKFGHAAGFGEPVYVFPVGKFKFTYVKDADFNSFYPRGDWSNDKMKYYLKLKAGDLKSPEEIKNMTIKIPAAMRAAYEGWKPDKYIVTNKNIEKAWAMEWEIWFQCKEYYFIKAGPKHLWKKSETASILRK